MPKAYSTQDRLQAVQRDGNLTLTDLAFWFSAPYQTVRGWVTKGREPSGAPLDVQHTLSILALTETMIVKKHGLPVPRLSRKERTAYLKKWRKVVLPGVMHGHCNTSDRAGAAR